MAANRGAGRRSPGVVALTIILVFVAGGLTGAVLARNLDRSASPPRHAASSSSTTSSSTSTSSSTTSTVPPTLNVISVFPASGAEDVAPNAPVTVSFSAPVSKDSPVPTLSPPAAGTWSATGSSFKFTPSSDYLPLSEITLTVPGGPAGVVGATGGELTKSVTERFQVANGSVVRIQQLLSLLDYSPLSWKPVGAAVAPGDTAAQVAALYKPPAGTYSWRNKGWPARLLAMWQPGVDNVFTRGLIMSFQADHALTPNGAIVASLWTGLVDALAANTVNTGGYNYALADKAAPESLTIYHNGAVAIRTPANTGIAASPTPDGTFPVFERLRRQVMKGTNPNGSSYADLVQYIAYFHGNDAVHYMDRADYGIPQSLGCIELPISDAARVWPYLAYGTLVTVIN